MEVRVVVAQASPGRELDLGHLSRAHRHPPRSPAEARAHRVAERSAGDAQDDPIHRGEIEGPEHDLGRRAAPQPEAGAARPLLLAERAVVQEVEEVGIRVGRPLRVADETERALLAPGLREDGEVVQHRQLRREEPESSTRGVGPRPERVSDRRDEDRRQEHGRRDDCARTHPPGSTRRREEQETRQQAQEVAVPHRSAAAVPVVGDDPDVGEPGERDRGESEPAGAVPRPAGEEEGERQHGREEVRGRPSEAAHPKVAEVPGKRLADLGRVARRPARRRDLLLVAPGHEGAQLVRRHPHAAVVEGRAARVERKAAVEGLALATLVVELAGEGGVQPIQARRGQHEDAAATKRLAEPAPEAGAQSAARPGRGSRSGSRPRERP